MSHPIPKDLWQTINEFCMRAWEGQIIMNLHQGRVHSYKLIEHGEVRESPPCDKIGKPPPLTTKT